MVRRVWCALLLAMAASAAPNPKSPTKPPSEQFVSRNVTARNFSCSTKCPIVVQCSCKGCENGVCTFDGGLDCPRWCTCECETEKQYAPVVAEGTRARV